MQITETISRDIQELKTKRDEVRVRAHLARQELKDVWERLEARWADVEQRVREIDGSPKERVAELAKALGGVLEEIRSEYRRLEGTTKKHLDS